MSSLERRGRCVRGERLLCFAAILFGLGGIRAMLLLSWCCMLVFLQLFEDVTWHGYVKSAYIVIPFQENAAGEVAIPIHGELVLFLDAHDQVFYVFLTRVFYTKVVHHKSD